MEKQARLERRLDCTAFPMTAMCACGHRWGAHQGDICPGGDRRFVLVAVDIPRGVPVEEPEKPLAEILQEFVPAPLSYYTESKRFDAFDGFTVIRSTTEHGKQDSPLTRCSNLEPHGFALVK